MAESTSLADPAPVSGADLKRAEEFAREPFVLEGEDADIALAPGTAAPPRARRRPGRARRGPRGALGRVAARVLADPGPRARAVRGRAPPRRRHDALGPPGRRAVGHADRADRRECPGQAEKSGNGTASPPPSSRSCPPARSSSRATTRSATTTSRSTGTPTEAEEADEEEAPAAPAEDAGANRRFWFEHATGAGKTVAALGFVEASRTGGVLILTHRRNLVDQFNGELRRPRLQEAAVRAPAGRQGQGPQRRGPGHGRDLPVVRAQRRQDLRRLHDRHLRRGPYRAGREDLGLDPPVAGPDLRGHDGHRRADRAPRHRPLPHPDLALRPGPGRPPRRDRAAALRAHPAGGRRALDLQGAAAQGRGRPGLRPGGAGRAARPDALQPGDRRPLQGALQGPARRGLHRRRAPRAQRGRGVPGPGHQGRGRVGRDAQARAHAHPGRLRARRDRRAVQRAAAGRGLELAARHRLHAPGAHGVAAHLPAAGGPRHPPPARARRRASSSTSCTRPPPTTTRWSPCTRCWTATCTAAARSWSGPCAAAAAGGCASSAACCR